MISINLALKKKSCTSRAYSNSAAEGLLGCSDALGTVILAVCPHSIDMDKVLFLLQGKVHQLLNVLVVTYQHSDKLQCLER